jgi:hypothetical protein
MKTKISVISFCFVLFFTTSSIAQYSGGGNPDMGLHPSSILLKENRQNATTVGKSNVVKIGFFGLFGLDPHLAYERVLTDKTTININVAFIGFNNNLPFTDIDADGDNVDVDLDTKLSIFTVTPEYRIYLSSKDVPRGFYLGPYLRYARYSYKFTTEVDTEDTNGDPTTVNVDIDGSMTTTGMGFHMGVQWVINDMITIDWGFLGLGLNRHVIKVTGSSDADNVDYAETAADIEENLEDIPLIGKRVSFDAENNSITAKIPFFYPAFRTNLKVGFLF